MSSERLKEEIAYLEDITKKRYFMPFVDFYINLYLNNSKKKTQESGKLDKIRELENVITEYSNQIVHINIRCNLNRASIDEETKNKNVLLSNKPEVKMNCIVIMQHLG